MLPKAKYYLGITIWPGTNYKRLESLLCSFLSKPIENYEENITEEKEINTEKITEISSEEQLNTLRNYYRLLQEKKSTEENVNKLKEILIEQIKKLYDFLNTYIEDSKYNEINKLVDKIETLLKNKCKYIDLNQLKDIKHDEAIDYIINLIEGLKLKLSDNRLLFREIALDLFKILNETIIELMKIIENIDSKILSIIINELIIIDIFTDTKNKIEKIVNKLYNILIKNNIDQKEINKIIIELMNNIINKLEYDSMFDDSRDNEQKKTDNRSFLKRIIETECNLLISLKDKYNINYKNTYFITNEYDKQKINETFSIFTSDEFKNFRPLPKKIDNIDLKQTKIEDKDLKQDEIERENEIKKQHKNKINLYSDNIVYMDRNVNTSDYLITFSQLQTKLPFYLLDIPRIYDDKTTFKNLNIQVEFICDGISKLKSNSELMKVINKFNELYYGDPNYKDINGNSNIYGSFKHVSVMCSRNHFLEKHKEDYKIICDDDDITLGLANYKKIFDYGVKIRNKTYNKIDLIYFGHVNGLCGMWAYLYLPSDNTIWNTLNFMCGEDMVFTNTNREIMNNVYKAEAEELHMENIKTPFYTYINPSGQGGYSTDIKTTFDELYYNILYVLYNKSKIGANSIIRKLSNDKRLLSNDDELVLNILLYNIYVDILEIINDRNSKNEQKNRINEYILELFYRYNLVDLYPNSITNPFMENFSYNVHHLLCIDINELKDDAIKYINDMKNNIYI